ncbi:fibronectin-like [Amphiura filiformis]|uniref:fibronectin-like n=1 Tax=Amphiura filiformis TaxID=82378 RepID=UPI003B210FA1
MSGIQRGIWVLFVIQVLAVNVWVSSAALSDLTTEADITVHNRGTDHSAQPINTIPTDANIYQHTPSKKDSSPETSPVETQLTEAITQANTVATAESSTSSTLGTDAIGSKTSNVNKQTTNEKITDVRNPTEQVIDLSSEHNVNERTNEVLTDNTPVQTEVNRDFTNLVESPDSDEIVSTQTNVVTNEQTTGGDLQSDKGTTSTEYLTTGKDPVSQLPTGKDTVVIEETTKRGSVTIPDRPTTDVATSVDERTSGSTHEASTNQNAPAVQETPGVSGTSSKDLPADGVTSRDNVIGTDVVTDVVTVTETPGTKGVEVTEGLAGNTTSKVAEKNVTYPDVLTTVAPPTTEMQTTSSPYLAVPCIQENPNITETSINLCLCKPVEGAMHYVAIANAVDGPSFYLRAGQNETDMDDDFDMLTEDSNESNKEVRYSYHREHHNTTVMSDGASLCAHFMNLTSGRQYNFTIQAMRSPTLPPESISMPLLAVTLAASPVLQPPRVFHTNIRLRWYFDYPIFVEYYNITYRWDDQIGFAATNLPGSQLEWDIYGLMPGGTYTFRVIVATQWTSAFSEVTRTMHLHQLRPFIRTQTPSSVNLAWVSDGDTHSGGALHDQLSLLNTNESKVVMLPGPWVEDNNFNITGLMSGGTYRFKLIAESGNRAKSAAIRMHTELVKPTINFTHTNETTLGINWAFPQPVIFEYYNFSYALLPTNYTTSSSPGSHGGRIESILPLWQNNLNLTDLTPGGRYAVQLQAVGELTSSMAQMVKGTRPERPSGVKVLNFDATSIELGWNQTFIDHVEFFQINVRSMRTGNIREVKSLGPFKKINNLLPGDNYRIWIRTVSYGEESRAAFVEQRTKLKGPMTVSVNAYTDTTVTIRWHIPHNNVVTDWTLWCEGPGCNLESADTYIYLKSRKTRGQHTFEGLISGEKYQFVVNVWSDLENLEGSVFQTTAPKRPVNLRVIDYSSTSISITWEAPTNSTVQEYQVTYQGMMETVTNNNSFSFVRRSLGADIENLIPGDFYVIKVQSITNGAKSVPVEEVQNTKLR